LEPDPGGFGGAAPISIDGPRPRRYKARPLSRMVRMSTKIEAFLKEKKIDPRRILVASSKIERLRPEDRAIRLKERQLRKTEDGAKKKEGETRVKPRSGRPVTRRALAAALSGKDVSGPAKSRILRAVNHVLEQKKQEKVALASLFEAPSKGNPPKKKKGETAE